MRRGTFRTPPCVKSSAARTFPSFPSSTGSCFTCTGSSVSFNDDKGEIHNNSGKDDFLWLHSIDTLSRFMGAAAGGGASMPAQEFELVTNVYVCSVCILCTYSMYVCILCIVSVCMYFMYSMYICMYVFTVCMYERRVYLLTKS